MQLGNCTGGLFSEEHSEVGLLEIRPTIPRPRTATFYHSVPSMRPRWFKVLDCDLIVRIRFRGGTNGLQISVPGLRVVDTMVRSMINFQVLYEMKLIKVINL